MMRISLTFRAILKATMALVIDIKITCDDTVAGFLFKSNTAQLPNGEKHGIIGVWKHN